MGWSRERTKFLRDNWTTMSVKEMAEKFGISETAVRGKAYRLGL
jgi:hypothetical protein